MHYKKGAKVLIIRNILTENIYCWGSWPQLFDESNFIWLRTNWWTQGNEVTEGCAGFRVSYQECDESGSTALSVTISLALPATSLPFPPLIRLLRRLILAADHQMAHWGRLPESRLEATQPDASGSDEGKHLAPACLIVDGTDNSIWTRPPTRKDVAADEQSGRGCQ